jgi:general secretion pathway protein A
MVLEYYKVAEQPFGVTPDPRYLYLSSTHKEAFGSLLYGLSAGRGFTALIGPPGMGKTTLLFQLLRQLDDNFRTAFIFQSQGTPRDFLHNLLFDLGIEDDGSDFVKMQAKLNETLLAECAQGRRFVVIIDEAQNLDESVLEVVRTFSNFETPRQKLMQIVLVGQPQLATKLASERLVQLRQRISIVARLEPLSAEDTGHYIDHRLRVAGYNFAHPLFTARAQEMIAKHAEGIPRNINNICFNAMSLGFVNKQRIIDRDTIQEVIGDLDLLPLAARSVKNVKTPISNQLAMQANLRSLFGGWVKRLTASGAMQ